MSEKEPLSVKRFLEQLKSRLEGAHPSLYLMGEVSNFRSSGRHWYFDLKEEGARLACAVWASQQRRIKHQPKDGERVLLRGSLNFYVPGGSLTLVVTDCEPFGLGDLQAQLRALAESLKREGLFDRPKRALPRFPRRLGVVAALGGAALRDVLEVTARRSPGLDVLIAPAAAQGERYVSENLLALQEISDPFWGCDVVLLVRGGGSIEDLWGYNHPDLVRAVAGCPVPVVTGVGHEIDTTLVDLAADQRAATPSQAAEVATADRIALKSQLHRRLDALCARMEWRLRGFESTLNLHLDHGLLRLDPLKGTREGLEALTRRLHQANPQRRLDQGEMRLLLLCQRLGHVSRSVARLDDWARIQRCHNHLINAMDHRLESGRRRLEVLQARLQGLNPTGPLERGFVMALGAQGLPVTSAGDVKAGDGLELCWKDGKRRVRVQKT